MDSPAANPKILYRNSRLLRMVFLQLHRQQRADLFCDVVLQAEAWKEFKLVHKFLIRGQKAEVESFSPASLSSQWETPKLPRYPPHRQVRRNPHGEAVPAHCCILSACSPFFTERLEREMPPKGHKVVLELRGLKIGPLRKLVDFLYTSEMEVSREEAQDVLAAAHQLQVSELESLQLEGGKLVKKALGRRLNRECLQLSSPVSSPVSIPEGHLVQSPPASGGHCLTSHPLARKQHTAAQLPFTKGTGNNSNTGQKRTFKKEIVIKSESKHQMSADSCAMAEFLTTKAKKRLAGTIRNNLDNEEISNLHQVQARSRDEQAVVGLQESKKIKLSRSQLSSLTLPCTTEDHIPVSSKISKSSRRFWRKKSPTLKIETKEAKVVSHLHDFLSPPLLPKATKGRKRSSSETAPSLNPTQDAGQVGRMMLRKVINCSCWEVVQKTSATQPMRAAGSVCASAEEGSLPQPKHPKQEVTATQCHASSTALLPVKAESPSLTEKAPLGEAGDAVTSVDGDCVGGDSYQLFMLDQLAEGEQYDNLAAAGELEHMLDFLLADDAAAVRESKDTTVPQSVPTSSPAPTASNPPLENAGAEEKHWCPAEVAVSPQWTEAENNPLQGEEGCSASTVSNGTYGLSNGAPFLNCANGSLPLVTSLSSNDGFPLCSLTSPEEESWTGHLQLPVLENGAMSLTAFLPSPEKQGLPFCEETTSGAETKHQAVQHHLDCKLPPLLTILEEDEIDVGGVEEFFLYSECIRPDSSPVSENEVDVVN